MEVSDKKERSVGSTTSTGTATMGGIVIMITGAVVAGDTDTVSSTVIITRTRIGSHGEVAERMSKGTTKVESEGHCPNIQMEFLNLFDNILTLA